MNIHADSLLFLQQQDTIADQEPQHKISPNAIDHIVDYKALDSIRFDLKNKKIFLFKEDDLSYDNINVKADYVEIDFTQESVYAAGWPDSTGKLAGKPVLTIDEESFESEKMRYNYTTRKGMVYNVKTHDEESYIHGEKVKKLEDNTSYIYRGRFTTCDLDHPHFALRFNKAKVIPNDKVITGPAYLELADVPLPIGLPFGYFPNQKRQKSGIIIPAYGESPTLGFYFTNGGYFWYINDYFTLELTGDLYTLGSWGISPKLTYRKRYKYNGNITLGFARNIVGEKGTPEYYTGNDYKIMWTHAQDAKARPNSKFNANVNILTKNFNKYNSNTNDYLNNSFQSSISYQTSFAKKVFFNISLQHNQSTKTNVINLTLPKISVNVNKFYPFRRAARVGSLRWYENISVDYNVNAEGRIKTADSLLFTQNLSKNFRNGAKHSVKVSSGSIKILNYINWTNNFNYTERWYSKKMEKFWLNDTIYENGEPQYGQVITDTINGFYAVRDFTFASSLNTTVYGMYGFKGGPVSAIRHVVKPSLSFNYRPDFSNAQWGYYQYHTDDNGTVVLYSMFEDLIYGTAPQGESGRINFSLNNNIEMKVRSKSDTLTGVKKVRLIDNLTLSTSYDLAKDSLNLSDIAISARTRLFKNVDLTYSSSWDPYALDSSGTRINKFEINASGKLVRPKSHSMSVGFVLRLNSDLLKGDEESSVDLKSLNWQLPWNVDLDYKLTYTQNYKYENGWWSYDITRTPKTIHTVGINGNVTITPKWKLGVRSGFDLVEKELTFTSLNINRDLHCWEMSFNWIPFGVRQSWNFTLRVKASMLKDVKYEKKNDYL